MTKKYKLMRKQWVEFTNPEGELVTTKMSRIKALRDIPAHNVKAGDIGGWVCERGILSHEGGCWIGGEAKVFLQYNERSKIAGNALVTDDAIVYGTGLSTIQIYENAIIEDNASIFVNGSSSISLIHADARVSGNAVVKNSPVITGKISDNALVVESYVRWASHVSGNAKVYNSTVSGSAMVMGDAIVSHNSIISESSVVTDDANISGAEVRGAAKVLENANVKEKAVICGNATVTDRAVISSGCVIAGESVIKDDAVVSEGATILGKSLVSQDAIIGAFEKYTDYASEALAIPTGQSQKSLTGAASSPETEMADIQDFSLKLDGLENEISAYGNDIVKLLKFPIMSDLRDKNTLEMMLALKNSKNIHPESNPKKFRKSVNSLERKFMKAESNARIICATAFSDEQRKKADKARDLFALACNDVSSEQEKKNAFKQGFRQLEGVVDVTDSAIENMRIKVGIPELEA